MEAMAMAITLLLSFLAMVTAVGSISYSVGDASGWAVGVDYNAWAANKTFAVGDILSFIYSQTHTVVGVLESDYQSCNTNNALTIYNSRTGSTKITLTSVGNYYWTCGTAGHCAAGMKLAIAVSSSTNRTSGVRGIKPDPAQPPATLSPPSTLTLPPQSGGKKENSSRRILMIAVPLIIILILFIGGTVCLCLRRKNVAKQVNDKDDEIKSVESLQYDFNTISIATNNFSSANKLGEGGFGSVYKGRLLDGQEIAVKRLSSNSTQGEKEFKNEVLLVAKLQHRNLVRLLGFCLEKMERLLIYEFVPNASLDQFIFDPTRRACLDWQTRFKILGGIARGLLYLHEDSHFRIIHRDLKASNILLDTGMNPKISDFGIARIFAMDESQGNTSTIVGTLDVILVIMSNSGYMAPEYVLHGQFSTKSDVFSFGVLLLEIISGQKNNSFHQLEDGLDLLCFAWKQWVKGTAEELIDSNLRGKCSRNEVIRCIQIGLLCVQDDVTKRPTMASIILMLNSNSVTLPWPSPPLFLTNNLSNSQMEDRLVFHEILKISTHYVQSDGEEPPSGSMITELESHPKRVTPPRVFGV